MPLPETDDLSEADDPPGAPEYVPGEETKTAEIPIRIEDGDVRLDESALDVEGDGSEDDSLPDLRDGATGTLRIRVSSLQGEDRQRFTEEHLEIIVPRSNLIWLKIRTGHLGEQPDYAEAYLNKSTLPVPKTDWTLIPVALQGHLWLRHRGAKAP